MGQTCGGSQTVLLGPTLSPGPPEPEGFRASLPLGWHSGRPFAGVQEPRAPLHARKFQVSVAKQPAGDSGDTDRGGGNVPPRGSWQRFYSLGPLLGDGVSAKVFQGEALSVLPQGLGPKGSEAPTAIGLLGRCGRLPPCLVERGRRVAIKRFHRCGSRTFKKELTALQRVGVHPHVLRLLESYEGFDGEDVLILEYCDGSTVYDLYAREHPHGGLPERLVARMLRQLLLALEHLVSRGVEHQDVKPENMMLYDVSVANAQAELKLGDFGWAALSGGASPSKPPPNGAGSLWYAPPELNPPVPNVTLPTDGLLEDPSGAGSAGKSDMWSVGVVAYLLLVGHNPFNAALRLEAEAVDAEVMRLAALGDFNRKSEKWTRLHVDAREFISVLLRVGVHTRMSATQALQHAYLARRSQQKSVEGTVFFHAPVSNGQDREMAWRQLDGLQQLAWVAIARAVAEPELDRQVIAAALDGLRASSPGGPPSRQDAAYLWQLARELGTASISQWLQDRPAWAEVLRLAFAYLDLDGDGLLGQEDLASHMAAHESEEIHTLWNLAGDWVARWQDPDAAPPLTSSGRPGLPLASFRTALLCTRGNSEDAIFDMAYGDPAAMGARDGLLYEGMSDELGLLSTQGAAAKGGAGAENAEEEELTDLRGIFSERRNGRERPPTCGVTSGCAPSAGGGGLGSSGSNADFCARSAATWQPQALASPGPGTLGLTATQRGI
eukprot:TRINITY_DN22466_c1_g6_i1.p1 TRINITY_DN22466_c1_g6~~TRINITY_DN22466_c1_g6_i1.p1  ORF type:complete len:722 (+),score=159.58 TRINITY_DN22466_c1_g6_i1:144-2309(+)